MKINNFEQDLYKCHLKDCVIVKDTKKCSGCNSIYYCCKEHQQENWSKHKFICQKLSKHRNCGEKDPILEISKKIYLNMGHIYGETGSYIKAINYYIKSIIDDPTHDLAYHNILLNIHYFENLDQCYDNLRYFNIKKTTDDTLQTYINKVHIKFAEILFGPQ